MKANNLFLFLNKKIKITTINGKLFINQKKKKEKKNEQTFYIWLWNIAHFCRNFVSNITLNYYGKSRAHQICCQSFYLNINSKWRLLFRGTNGHINALSEEYSIEINGMRF